MSDDQSNLNDLPILMELRDELSGAFELQDQASAATPKRWMRPRILASATACGAAVAATLALVLGSVATAPALAITRSADGSVLVKLDYAKDLNLPQLNAKLTSMGIDEQVTIFMAAGPATVSGPVVCTPGPGAGVPNPPVRILDGTNGTEVISPGGSAGNTAEGTFHLARCTVAPDSDTGPGTGNTGNPGVGSNPVTPVG
jgi:hypothetical protein